MVLKKKSSALLSVIFVLFFTFSFSAFGAKELSAAEKLSDSRSGIMSIARRGDTAVYPENSLEGILSAKEKGADMVSVGVHKTSDGIYVLCDKEALGNICNASYASVSEITYDETQKYYLYDNTGTLTQYKMVSLAQAVENTDDELILILDIDWAEKDGIYGLISNYSAFNRVIIRTEESASKIKKWILSKEIKPSVIGVYDGNIVFNAISHFSTLSEIGMPFMQYESANHFNVMYSAFVADRFIREAAPRVIAPMYDPDFCGQRTDSENGWNELIEKGYSVIETNNLASLVSYIEKTDTMAEELYSLSEKAKAINTEAYSLVSKENLSAAIENADEVCLKGSASADEIERCYSALILAMNELNIKTGEDTQKGALNITAGKIIAAVLVGAVIIAAQIYVHKMQQEKKREKDS